ncbi:hypothetical protein BCR42DRAFT_443208 [Absidia repens]|uniref:Hydrophobin n=1 Tax=Absidia repens TaxID=90262 RepID=A0A1X2I010_9FUNG|nr:hypothetical protein BCR42DRAFT_443208 [Absidia repens]
MVRPYSYLFLLAFLAAMMMVHGAPLRARSSKHNNDETDQIIKESKDKQSGENVSKLLLGPIIGGCGPLGDLACLGSGAQQQQVPGGGGTGPSVEMMVNLRMPKPTSGGVTGSGNYLPMMVL